MKKEHEIVAQVYAAKENSQAADALISQYLPFIKSETAKNIGRASVEGRDDELTIAMTAFHEAVMAYHKEKGAFLPFARTAIRNRLIDYSRKEMRHVNQISLDEPTGDDVESQTLMEQLDTGSDEIAVHVERTAIKDEIMHFSKILSAYGLTLTKVAENSPKQGRTLAACHQTLAYAKAHPELLQQLETSRKLPLIQLAEGAGVERKTLERHRKYLVAIMLAYTNGFDNIREHLSQVAR